METVVKSVSFVKNGDAYILRLGATAYKLSEQQAQTINGMTATQLGYVMFPREKIDKLANANSTPQQPLGGEHS